MNERKRLISLTAGALAGSLVAAGAIAADQPFKVTSVHPTHLVADSHAEGGCGEGKCGEGRCGGADKGAHKHTGPATEGRCGEGKCGEGKCGGDDHGAHAHGSDKQSDSA